ncbi:lipocalin family protein [Arcobacter roscoffensis]|uniref:Lipocalin family protein n=1 Tax=Arcobacter roscoffensis TaxID=2961520 RepID=A0ABY5DZU5_9BACT|nr:lipocalin family protein [Arcobacter roscoffensis]UTJ05122.1 lipocalin family protein [Arcobacter roscoffensis]|tara:strand:+ start:396 stop:914 length:519 start_codon:yes stop_codon:yes gene_type:complete
MSVKLFIILAMFSLLHSKPLKSVQFVDPKSFSGIWYEIARTHNSFQENCIASTVEYSLIDTNKYKVFNRCFENQIGGKLIEYSGIAKALDDDSMSSMKMTYFWIFSKKYNVIYLNNYKSAVVADDDLENLWIMNRKPFMAKEEQKKIIDFLSDYINVNSLIYTKQDEKGRYK